MNDETIEVRVARLDERVKALDGKVDGLTSSQQSQSLQLTMLVSDMHKRQGADATKRAFRATIFTALTSTGFLGWLWEHFHK